jgi:putative endonuclease
MLKCADDSFYVGSTSHDDVGRRVDEHNDDKFDGYTHSRRPVVLVWCEWCSDLRNAHELERKLKGWNRAKKQALVDRDWEQLKELAKRPGARRSLSLTTPSRLASLAPQGDALEPKRDAFQPKGGALEPKGGALAPNGAALAPMGAALEQDVALAPNGDALGPKCATLDQGDALEHYRHPEVAAQRPSKGDGEVAA